MGVFFAVRGGFFFFREPIEGRRGNRFIENKGVRERVLVGRRGRDSKGLGQYSEGTEAGFHGLGGGGPFRMTGGCK
jgi:hypothetical protein